MSRIGLIGENSVEYIKTLLDIWNNNNCAVIINWQIPCKTAIEMMQQAEVHICYIETSVFIQSYIHVQTEIEFILFDGNTHSAEMLPDNLYNKFGENYSKNEAIVIYSSGTTGKAKGVILSYYAIQTNADAIISYMAPTNSDCLYIAKPLSYSSALIGELLVALKMHIKLVIAPSIVPPRFVLKYIQSFSVSILCLCPMMLSLYVQEYMPDKFDISSLRVIYVSGSILNNKLCGQAREKFRNIPIYNVYGLSEAGPRVTAQTIGCCSENSVGMPIIGVEVKIIDEAGNEVAKNEKGIIHINTPSLFMGYISGSSQLTSLYKGWLNSGDIGYMGETGELFIVERCDDVAVFNSHKIYPNEINNVVHTYPLICDCVTMCIANEDNKVDLVCFYVSSQTVSYKELIKYLHSCLPPYETPSKFIRITAVPVQHNGKIDRQVLKKIYVEREM